MHRTIISCALGLVAYLFSHIGVAMTTSIDVACPSSEEAVQLLKDRKNSHWRVCLGRVRSNIKSPQIANAAINEVNKKKHLSCIYTFHPRGYAIQVFTLETFVKGAPKTHVDCQAYGSKFRCSSEKSSLNLKKPAASVCHT